jgi:phenylpropionate dioxygenase-like ring-hydroxylating dioxygenase large terminal subunit
MRYGGPDSTRDARRRRYLHERVLRRALQDDARLLERVQHGLGNLEPGTTLPIDEAQPGLRWFVERCRAAFGPALDAANKRGTRPRRPRAAIVPAPT